MIYMLSRFDLKEGRELADFRESYARFVKGIISVGLAEEAGEIGMRVENTPMDTDEKTTQKYFSIMAFKDRKQLDKVYDYLSGGEAQPAHLQTHGRINKSIENAVFTCWEDLV